MPATQLLPVGPVPTLNIEDVHGHLTLTGWDRPELLARGPKGDGLTFDAETSTVTVDCHGHCTLQTPLQSMVHVVSVDGHAAINLVLGMIEIEQVDGNLQLNSTGGVTIGSVDGSLSARAVAGNLTADKVDGNARIFQVAGNLRLDQVDGNLQAADVVGNLEASVDGNAQVRVALARGQRVKLTADGNITCHVQSSLIESGGARVRLEADGKLRVLNLGEERKARETCLEFTLGDGAALIDLRADGDITLVGVDVGADAFDTAGIGVGMAAGFDPELGEEMSRRAEELGRQISEQVEVQVSALTREMEEKLSRFGNDEEMANKLQDRLGGIMRRAEEKLAEAMRRMEVRTAEAERRGAEGDRRRKGYGWQAPPPPPVPPAPPPPAPPKRPQATDEERMIILRMVEGGKISVEQAEKLLSALNG